jgi:hypothetical protein
LYYLGTEVREKWQKQGLKTLSKERIERGNSNQTVFAHYVQKVFMEACKEKTLSDIQVTFSEDDENVRHTILVQPTHPRIYDSQVGEVIYKTHSDMAHDLAQYCSHNKVNEVVLKLIGVTSEQTVRNGR